ncbi:MAG: RdgB/HAM1 family non-canonical purine NTP pyrophosphatase [Planctomycetota bacterium]|jgi:XTP/dITP diphosphohydrolase|nr:RdgB/HAM1 family non-canonical purine NTP pyrophosphatase [Planctomycetota bacterium]
MSRKIFVASGNSKKLSELRSLCSDLGVEVLSPADADANLPQVTEDGDSFLENATKKAIAFSEFAVQQFGEDVWALADDSGLCVDYLDGAPGVHSARYANDNSANRDQSNNLKLLRELSEANGDQRTASFWCVIAVAHAGELLFAVEGSVNGTILQNLDGDGGFGYDPLFYHVESASSFANLAPEQKAKVSHRGQAIARLRNVLESVATKS